MKYGWTWSKMPRLPISPQKPRHENATMPEIPHALKSDKIEFPGNITAAESEDDVRLREDLRKSVARNLELDLRLVAIRTVRNRGFGGEEKKEIAREESTRGGDEINEEEVVAILCNTRNDLFF